MDNRIIPRVRPTSGRRSVWPTAIAVFTLTALVSVACGDDKHHSTGASSGSAKTPGGSAAPGQSVPGQPTSGQPGGGGPAAGATGGGGGGATATGVTDTEIKMGMLSELSGPIAVYGQSFPKVAQAFF